MKYQSNRVSLVLLAAGALIGAAARGADQASSPKADPAMEAMLKKVEAASLPGAAHKALEPLIGNWTAEVKTWMSPDAPPTVTQGTARTSWVLNGRFIQEEFNGEFMGKPFRGISFAGYDNVRQKYSNVWMDDMSTTMWVGEGEASPDGKVITFGGTYACAMTGEKQKAARQTFRILGPDKHIFEMHDPALGANSKTLEITYTRK